MRLFIKWKFNFILFELSLVSAQTQSINQSKYHSIYIWNPLSTSITNLGIWEEMLHLLSTYSTFCRWAQSPSNLYIKLGRGIKGALFVCRWLEMKELFTLILFPCGDLASVIQLSCCARVSAQWNSLALYFVVWITAIMPHISVLVSKHGHLFLFTRGVWQLGIIMFSPV